ncbi:MAG: polymer-forming cytoskeletal protein [Acidobacteria bacterium]|nr:polymer-forming cytoskeletal protein [Acidobacteriota bacterium]
MRQILKGAILLPAWIILAALAIPPAIASPGPGLAAALTGRNEDVQFGGEVHIREGEVHQGDLVVIGGSARIEGEVQGDIVVIMGGLYMSGKGNQDVVTVLSTVELADGAVIEGSFVNVLGGLEQASEIEIEGDFVDISFLDLSGLSFHGIGGGFLHLLLLIKAFSLAILFVIIIVIAAVAPERVAFAGNAFPTDWPKALLYGVIAYCVFFMVAFILCITLIGIPIAIALCLAMKVAKWMGYAAIFFMVGDRIGRNLFNREFSLFPSLLIGYLIFGILKFIPLFVGEMIWMGLAVLGVGISLSTRFGSGQPWFQGKSRPAPSLPPATPPGGEVPPPPAQSEGSPAIT